MPPAAAVLRRSERAVASGTIGGEPCHAAVSGARAAASHAGAVPKVSRGRGVSVSVREGTPEVEEILSARPGEGWNRSVVGVADLQRGAVDPRPRGGGDHCLEGLARASGPGAQ